MAVAAFVQYADQPRRVSVVGMKLEVIKNVSLIKTYNNRSIGNHDCIVTWASLGISSPPGSDFYGNAAVG